MVVLFLALLLLTRWITRHVQGVGYLVSGDGQAALVLSFLLILPGVILHETSHVLVAWLLRVRVRRLSLGLRRKGVGRQIALGSVDIAQTDPLRASLIGLAPLIAGLAVILLIGGQVLHLEALPTPSKPGFWAALVTAYATPDFWLWVYLVLAIGNAMLPSAADRQSWGVAIGFIAVIGAAFYFSGLLEFVSQPIARWARTAATRLTYAFGITVFVDLAFAVVLFAVENGLALLGLGRVQYH
jgi:membrane-associated protease RseP (regulator of RpoE activity)